MKSIVYNDYTKLPIVQCMLKNISISDLLPILAYNSGGKNDYLVQTGISGTC